MDVLGRLQLEVPVVQAGLGGGLSRAELAGAVSVAGGLGTVGIAPPRLLAKELREARDLAAGRPVAVNLLLPFVTGEHVDVCAAERPPVVVLFCGFDRALVERLHGAGSLVLHQIGTVAAAVRALADGADGLILQGVEAGGHVLASQPLRAMLAEVRTVAKRVPLLGAGADAVVAGSRFLLTHECHAHPAYQRRVAEASSTVITRLFGLGWRDPHRVVPNAAVRRWCAEDGSERRLAGVLSSALLPAARRVPLSQAGRVVRAQRLTVPLFSPAPVLRGQDERLADVTPLYAGAGVNRLTSVISAAEVVRRLTP